MSKWTPPNEYVPVTKGSTAVVTLQSDGDVYGYMDENTTGALLASASAGVTKIPTGGFSKITCTAPFILTTESALSRRRGGQNGGGGGASVENWITVNDAGEAVLNFPVDRDISNSYQNNNFTSVFGTTGAKTDCSSFLRRSATLQDVAITLPNAYTCTNIVRDCTNLQNLQLHLRKVQSLNLAIAYNVSLQTAIIYAPEVTNCHSALRDSPSLVYADFHIPNATDCSSIYYGCSSIKKVIANCPSATNLQYLISRCSSLTDFDIFAPLMSTLDFTSESGNGGLGNVTTLENVTILDGGLAACTSYIITNSTNLTDASIQNIIDALPDYSGTGTSALVSFPPDRLTTEQQAQLTSKGWTWS